MAAPLIHSADYTPSVKGITHGVEWDSAKVGAEAFAPEAGWLMINELPERYMRSVKAVQSVVRARTMDEHSKALHAMGIDVRWDAPPVLLEGRDAMRQAVYWAKSVGELDMQPICFKVMPIEADRDVIWLEVAVSVKPFKYWWLPPTWLLPSHIPLRGLLKVGIRKGAVADGSDDHIMWIKGRMHNLPALPNIMRWFSALFMGHLPLLTEPIWGPIIGGLGLDPSYSSSTGTAPRGTTTTIAGGGYGAKPEKHGITGTIVEGAKGAVDTVTGTAKRMGEAVAAKAQHAKDSAVSIMGATGKEE